MHRDKAGESHASAVATHLSCLLQAPELLVHGCQRLFHFHHAALRGAHQCQTHPLADCQLPLQAPDLAIELGQMASHFAHLRAGSGRGVGRGAREGSARFSRFQLLASSLTAALRTADPKRCCFAFAPALFAESSLRAVRSRCSRRACSCLGSSLPWSW